MEMASVLQAFSFSQEVEVGQALLGNLENHPSFYSLRTDLILSACSKQPDAIQSAAATLVAKLDLHPSEKRARLKQLSSSAQCAPVFVNSKICFHLTSVVSAQAEGREAIKRVAMSIVPR